MNSFEKRLADVEGMFEKTEYMACIEDLETGKYRLIGKGVEDTALYSLDYIQALARSQGKQLMVVSYEKRGVVNE